MGKLSIWTLVTGKEKKNGEKKEKDASLKHLQNPLEQEKMKYKQLYFDAQVRFANKLSNMQSKFGNIRSIITGAEYSLQSRRDELSPELFSYLMTIMGEVDKECLNQTIYYNEANNS